MVLSHLLRTFRITSSLNLYKRSTGFFTPHGTSSSDPSMFGWMRSPSRNPRFICSMSSQRKFIMDVDTGVDDAQALMMLLADPEAEVLAVTCTGGNAGLDDVCKNTLSVLHVMGKMSVPVFRGCPVPILRQVNEGDHDGNGMHGYHYPDTPSLDNVQTEHACSAISRLVKQYPGEVTLLATAPLTNIAVASRMDPSIAYRLKNIVIMGGNLKSKGGYFMCADFNFGFDPEAAHIVLSTMECPITLVTTEICIEKMNLPWEWYERLTSVDTPRGRFHRDIDAPCARKRKDRYKSPGYYSCDPLAASIALDPSVALSSESAYCTVELGGAHSRGSLVVDRKGQLGRKNNVKLVTAVDTSKIQKMFERMVE